ncbi:DUF4397 domain-containing protein [Streptomyces abyssomicinicus]|uniref:DUF4397 domain-containing protein n=1 Tax=Streptomyces abyssomicinicus TaxID=574929 RepID=UPI00124FA8C1|nr:DUF4397 domain-containing protein [Streptomyces abyssomicinicus]
MTSRTPLLIGASAGACALALAVAAPSVTAAAADSDWTGTVSVFHGVPGTTVDVYANGDRLLGDFKPGTVTKPQALDAGTYEIQLFKAGQGPDGTPVLEKKVQVPEGADATIAAHLSADGEPQLTTFKNDTSKVDAGQARLTVRHVAAAPAVDVRAGGEPVFTGLTNPNQDSTVVDAGTVNADVTLAGTGTVAIGPADLNLKAGSDTVVYAWGSADDQNLALATQTLGGTESSPNAVHAGGTGAAAAVTPNSPEAWLAWAAVTGLVTLTGVRVAHRVSDRRG